VADVKVLEEARRQLVGAGGAARAAVLPLRVEHEVVDDQLRTVLEHVDEADRTVRTVEDVVLLDLNHGQVAPLGVERIPPPGQVLLLCEQLLTGGQPLVSRSDLRKAHSQSPWLATWAGT